MRESLGASDAAYGLLLAAWGAGTVLSSIALTRVRATSPIVLIPRAPRPRWAPATWLVAVSPVVALAAARLPRGRRRQRHLLRVGRPGDPGARRRGLPGARHEPARVRHRRRLRPRLHPRRHPDRRSRTSAWPSRSPLRACSCRPPRSGALLRVRATEPARVVAPRSSLSPSADRRASRSSARRRPRTVVRRRWYAKSHCVDFRAQQEESDTVVRRVARGRPRSRWDVPVREGDR